jgi:hypothetical protein
MVECISSDYNDGKRETWRTTENKMGDGVILAFLFLAALCNCFQ